MNDDDRFELKSGGGCMALFGLPFLLIGISVIASVFIPAEVRNGDPIPWYFGIPFGSIFTAVGGSLIFGRSLFVIDKINDRVIKSWCLFAPLKKEEYDLSEFNKIKVTKEVRRGNNSTTTVYPVYLEGEDTELNVQESQLYNESRKLSEELSNFLNFDVWDSSTGSTLVRKAGTMDKSVREQILESGEEIIIPDEPENIRSQCYMLGDTFVAEIPPIGFKLSSIISLLSLLFFFPFLSVFFTDFNFYKEFESMPLAVVVIMAGFMSLFILVPISIAYKAMIKPIFAKSKLELNKYELRYIESAIFSKTTIIDCDEIEEISISGGVPIETQDDDGVQKLARSIARLSGKVGGIIVRTDKQTLAIGSHLDIEELKYIEAIMKQTLIT